MDEPDSPVASARRSRWGGAGSNRTRILAAGLGLVVVASLGGWFAGSRIASPAEIAARAQPPPASLVTVAVERRMLSADIVTRGEIGYADPISLSLGGATGDPDARQVVTSVAEKGAELVEGSVALGVGGRPVLLLQGALPSYRDLRPGATGADVAQLEEALVRLGHLSSADDSWTPETGSALASLYATVGYLPSEPGTATEDAIVAARQQVREAERLLRELEGDTTTSGGPPLPSQVLAARAAVADTHEAVVLAQAQRAQGDAVAKAAVESARVGVEAATSAVTQAQAWHDQAAQAVDPLTGEPTSALDRAALDDARVAAAAALNDARTLLGDAEAAVGVTAIGGENTEAAARRALTVAQAALGELERPTIDPASTRQRQGAAADLDRAKSELAALVTAGGTWLPAGEVTYLSRFPVQVATREVTRGQVLDGPYMTVAGATTTMKVTLSAGDATRLSLGDEVLVDEPGLAAPLSGTVSVIPDRAGTGGPAPDAEGTEAATTDGAAGGGGRVTVTVDLAAVPDNLIGSNVRVVIPVDTTAGEVLVVPAAALSAVADGGVRVQVEDSDAAGGARFVTVTTGLASAGDVEVQPVEGALAEGDRVVVGLAGRSTPSGSPSGGGTESSSDPAPTATERTTEPTTGASSAN